MKALPEVRAMNQVKGRGLLMAEGTYVAFDMVEGTLNVGDRVEGDLTYGPCTWRNVTTGQVVRVYVQHLASTVEAANQFNNERPAGP
jgi:hypothetical protein